MGSQVEQVKVILALAGEGESEAVYAESFHLLCRRDKIELPPLGCLVLEADHAQKLRSAALVALRAVPMAKTWTFLMGISRYNELCDANMSDTDPMPHVRGCLPHVLEGDEILGMTGYPKVLAVTSKVNHRHDFPPTFTRSSEAGK